MLFKAKIKNDWFGSEFILVRSPTIEKAFAKVKAKIEKRNKRPKYSYMKWKLEGISKDVNYDRVW